MEAKEERAELAGGAEVGVCRLAQINWSSLYLHTTVDELRTSNSTYWSNRLPRVVSPRISGDGDLAVSTVRFGSIRAVDEALEVDLAGRLEAVARLRCGKLSRLALNAVILAKMLFDFHR